MLIIIHVHVYTCIATGGGRGREERGLGGERSKHFDVVMN